MLQTLTTVVDVTLQWRDVEKLLQLTFLKNEGQLTFRRDEGPNSRVVDFTPFGVLSSYHLYTGNGMRPCLL